MTSFNLLPQHFPVQCNLPSRYNNILDNIRFQRLILGELQSALVLFPLENTVFYAFNQTKFYTYVGELSKMGSDKH